MEKKPEQKVQTRTLAGVVVSARMKKTVVVSVTRFSMNKKYRTQVKNTRRFKAHDENGEYKVGDRVEIEATRPLSKEKRFRVSRLVERPAKISVEE